MAVRLLCVDFCRRRRAHVIVMILYYIIGAGVENETPLETRSSARKRRVITVHYHNISQTFPGVTRRVRTF